MSLIHRIRWTGVLLACALLTWAALAPLRYPTREVPLTFGQGPGQRAPAALALTLGVRDVLLLRNRDRVAHVFGQVRVAPDHDFRLPFETAGTFAFACDAAPGAQVAVRVDPHPDPGWPRLRWRLRTLADAVRTLPVLGPED
jgi:hypothetical protein